MIFHASIPARDPARVAAALAELWGGECLPFPPWPGAFVAMAGDARNSTIEVYPREQVMAPGKGEEMVRPAVDAAPHDYACFHLAVATPLGVDEVLAIASREGWRAIRLSRGGVFDVVELWVENAVMLEVLTQEMQADYLRTMTIPGWKAFLAAPPQAEL